MAIYNVKLTYTETNGNADRRMATIESRDRRPDDLTARHRLLQRRTPLVFDNISALLYSVSIWVLPAVTAITLHEAAHGWVAWKLGDDTARRLGRVSFNPARHIHPFGTLVLPGLLLVMNAPFPVSATRSPCRSISRACGGRSAT